MANVFEQIQSEFAAAMQKAYNKGFVDGGSKALLEAARRMDEMQLSVWYPIEVDTFLRTMADVLSKNADL